jgi:hypothetical protein
MKKHKGHHHHHQHEHHHVDPVRQKDRDQAIKIVEQEMLEATKELQKHLFTLSLPNPLHTDEQRAAKCQHDAEEMFQALRTDIKRGVECYEQYVHPTERGALKTVFDKVFEQMEKVGRKETLSSLTNEDLAPLDAIATRTFAEKHLKEASCMWRFIIQLQPANSRAWVGWALAEQENHHIEIVEYIYNLGRELLPHDIYLAWFAADFYLTENKADMSREIINNTITTLKGIEGIPHEAFDVLNEKLVEIEQFQKTLMSLKH